MVAGAPCLTGHVDPRMIMEVGTLNGNIPAPLMAIDEDDEFFLTLTNVGQVMRARLDFGRLISAFGCHVSWTELAHAGLTPCLEHWFFN